MKRFIRPAIIAALSLILTSAIFAIANNYTLTQGSGTTFGSIAVGGVNYVQHMLCDLTTPSQCTAVNSSGQVAIQAPPSLPLPTGASTSANQSTEITALQAIQANTGAAVPAGTNLIGNVGTITPAGATAITASATGTTAATTATLAGTSGKTTYMCWMSIRANATAAATGNATVTGTITGTLNFTQWTAPLASGIGIVEEIFNPCVPASGTNTGIAIISAAPGSGGTVSVSGGGYQM